MIMDEYDGQMIFGDLVGLKLPDICLTGEEKSRKNLTQETCPDRGSNPGPLRDRRACSTISNVPSLLQWPGHTETTQASDQSAAVYFFQLSISFTVRDRVMSHDACTSGTSRVLTIASLQRLKLEALIPTPAGCKVWSVINFSIAQSTAPIEIHDTGLVLGEFRVQIPVLTKHEWSYFRGFPQ